MPVAVSIQNLRVDLGGQIILHDISLEVETGSALALMGPNGSGKSTLVKTITGINPIAGGRIAVFGTEAQEARQSSLWQKVGYVPQRFTAAAGVPATALEVVMSGLLGKGRLLRRRGDKQKALTALEIVGLAHRAKESVQTFSGGQQQRVLIARALVRNPELLIMDEPTAGVDHISQEAFAQTVKQFHEQGKTLIIVLHELGVLKPHISRTVHLQGGHLRTDGTADGGHHFQSTPPPLTPTLTGGPLNA
ncbi:MAG: ABC transporter ATP-binding protein [Actinomycetaceae bacterium]|nr:ABC transporter ATP-binding protein [Actinomycetaceae bacterium]